MLRVLGCFAVVLFITTTVYSLKCFNCENRFNPACGIYFKPYQFKAHPCPGPDYKCALQRQTSKDGWVGIVRICYQLGSLNGINETNGCKNWTNVMLGYTAYYCFCDTDYCNSAVTIPQLNIIPISLLLYVLIV